MNETRQHPEENLSQLATKRSGVGAVALLALLLALAAAGFSAWQWWQARATDSAEVEIRAQLENVLRRLDDIDGAQGRFAQRLAGSEQSGEALAALQLDIARLQSQADTALRGGDDARERLEALEKELLSANERLAGVEAGIAALAVRGESPTVTMELAHVEFLLSSANERLQLFGDVQSADQALQLADAQLGALGDPLYLPVRRSIAEARLKLEAVPELDLVGITARLAQMQAGLSSLPLAGEDMPTGDAGDEAPAEESSIWERFKATMAGLVTVRRRVADETIISLDDTDTIRQGLWLQLESARLALMRTDTRAWANALGRAEATLDQYFRSDSARVSTLRESLVSLQGIEFNRALPDISLPWTQLKLLRTGTPDGGSSATAVEQPAATDDPGVASPGSQESPGSPVEPGADTPEHGDEDGEEGEGVT